MRPIFGAPTVAPEFVVKKMRFHIFPCMMIINTKSDSSSDRGSVSARSIMTNGDQRDGLRNRTEQATDSLPDIVQDQLEYAVASKQHGVGIPHRSTTTGKKRCSRLVNVKKRSERSDFLLLVQRAKDIKAKIDAKKRAYLKKNGLTLDRDDDVDVESNSSGSLEKRTNVLDGNGEFQRRETKKRKVEHLNAVISNVTEQQVATATVMATPLDDVATKLSVSSSFNNDELKSKLDRLEAKLDLLLERLPGSR